MGGLGDWYFYEIALWMHAGIIRRHAFRNRLKCHLFQSNRYGFRNHLFVTYCSKFHRLSLSLRHRLYLVRLGGYIVNLSEFYSYRLIGKLTVFFQFQEFVQRNQIVDSSTTAARLLLLCLNLKLETFSPRLQLYVLILT